MSIFEQLGGEKTIDSLVERFYRRLLADPRLSHFFASVDMTAQLAKHKAFMTLVLGGPHQYSGRNLRDAHRGLSISDIQYDAVAGHLADTLRELALPQHSIDAALDVVEIARDAVLNR